MKTRIFALCAIVLCACNKEDTIGQPENLTISIEVSTDGSGLVEIIAEAQNTSFYKFYFGDVTNETPTKATIGGIPHTYTSSGTYTITVQAHATETVFISDTKSVTVEVFIQIPEEGYSTPTTYPAMNLLWGEEFSGTTIDETKWTFELGDGCPNVCGWGNNELEYYKKENATIVDGNLVIEAKKESVGGRNYTSTRMITKSKVEFKYGRVDVRAALPKGQGIWPAIWMLGANINDAGIGWPKCGEIDIMEMIGGGIDRDNKVYGTAHWDNAGSYASYGGNKTLASGIFNDKFHVFSITWDSQFIRWYLDDVQYHVIDITPAGLSEFNLPYFIILNVAVGGNWPGNPNGSTKFPQRMIVDYVRVFQNQ